MFNMMIEVIKPFNGTQPGRMNLVIMEVLLVNYSILQVHNQLTLTLFSVWSFDRLMLKHICLEREKKIIVVL